MTDTMFTRTALTEAAKGAGVTTDQARTILEAAGVKVQPEKPAPGLYLHEDGRPIIMIGPNFTEPDSYLTVTDDSHWTGRNRDKLTPARIVPAATPVALTEDQVGEVWDKDSVPLVAWRVLGSRNRERITATVNTFLTQHAAPAEDMPDWDDVRNAVASQRGNGWSLNDDAINGITDAVMRLLHREEA